jgi:hypothetical protein
VPRVRFRRQSITQRELDAWDFAFQTGDDFLGELAHIGIDCVSPCTSAPDRKVCEEAWHRLGAAWIRQRPHPEEPWALRAFAQPGSGGGRRTRQQSDR